MLRKIGTRFFELVRGEQVAARLSLAYSRGFLASAPFSESQDGSPSLATLLSGLEQRVKPSAVSLLSTLKVPTVASTAPVQGLAGEGAAPRGSSALVWAMAGRGGNSYADTDPRGKRSVAERQYGKNLTDELVLYDRVEPVFRYKLFTGAWCGILASQLTALDAVAAAYPLGVGPLLWYGLWVVEGLVALGTLNFAAKRAVVRLSLPHSDSDRMPTSLLVHTVSPFTPGLTVTQLPVAQVMGFVDCESQFARADSDLYLWLRVKKAQLLVAKRGRYYHLDLFSKIANAPLARFVRDSALDEEEEEEGDGRGIAAGDGRRAARGAGRAGRGRSEASNADAEAEARARVQAQLRADKKAGKG